VIDASSLTVGRPRVAVPVDASTDVNVNVNVDDPRPWYSVTVTRSMGDG